MDITKKFIIQVTGSKDLYIIANCLSETSSSYVVQVGQGLPIHFNKKTKQEEKDHGFTGGVYILLDQTPENLKKAKTSNTIALIKKDIVSIKSQSLTELDNKSLAELEYVYERSQELLLVLS